MYLSSGGNKSSCRGNWPLKASDITNMSQTVLPHCHHGHNISVSPADLVSAGHQLQTSLRWWIWSTIILFPVATCWRKSVMSPLYHLFVIKQKLDTVLNCEFPCFLKVPLKICFNSAPSSIFCCSKEILFRKALVSNLKFILHILHFS